MRAHCCPPLAQRMPPCFALGQSHRSGLQGLKQCTALDLARGRRLQSLQPCRCAGPSQPAQCPPQQAHPPSPGRHGSEPQAPPAQGRPSLPRPLHAPHPLLLHRPPTALYECLAPLVRGLLAPRVQYATEQGQALPVSGIAQCGTARLLSGCHQAVYIPCASSGLLLTHARSGGAACR